MGWQQSGFNPDPLTMHWTHAIQNQPGFNPCSSAGAAGQALKVTLAQPWANKRDNHQQQKADSVSSAKWLSLPQQLANIPTHKMQPRSVHFLMNNKKMLGTATLGSFRNEKFSLK